MRKQNASKLKLKKAVGIGYLEPAATKERGKIGVPDKNQEWHKTASSTGSSWPACET